MNRTTIAVDIAKSVFQLSVADGDWRVQSRHRLTRMQLVRFFSERQPCDMVMEACGSAHFWGRWLRSLGFTVRLFPPQYVRAYVRRNKTESVPGIGLLAAAHRMTEIDHRRGWALAVERQRGRNKTAVALANRLARVAWAVWRHDRSFESRPLHRAA